MPGAGPLQAQAFAVELAAGRVPSVRAIAPGCMWGQPGEGSRAGLPPAALYSCRFGYRLGRSGSTCCRDTPDLPSGYGQVNQISAHALERTRTQAQIAHGRPSLNTSGGSGTGCA